MGDRPVPVNAVDPLPLLTVILASGAYALGAARGRLGRGSLVRAHHAVAWTVGAAALVAAFAGPVAARSATSLSAHMVQHLLLTLVAAPLLVLSAPVLPLLLSLPRRMRRRAALLHTRARRLRRSGALPLVAVAVYAATGWLWHLPGPYEAALHHDLVHATEHATLLGTAVLLWWTIVRSGDRSAFGYGTGIGVVFLAALQHAGLGAVMTLAPSPLYPTYAAGGTASALADQQLAGTLMWAPGKLLHGAVVALLVVAWLRDVEARTARREQAVRRAA